MSLKFRLITLASALSILALAAPSVASASHQKGGSLSVSATSNGHLTGTVVYMDKYSCNVGDTGVNSAYLQVTAPDNSTQYVPVSLDCTASIPNTQTNTGNFDIDIAATFGSYPGDGFYKVHYNDCCRIAGIQNISNSDSNVEAGVHVTAGQATTGPNFNSNVATGIAKGARYYQSLNASGTKPLVYSSLVGSAEGPSYDVISLTNTGIVDIPAAVTSTFTNGQYYVYRVQATDPAGNYGQRDVLLRVTDTHTPPTISGLNSQYTVSAGGTQTVNFTASDTDFSNSQTVDFIASGLPNWVTFTKTAGNPASGQLVISPPAGTPNSSFTINIDAYDNDNVVPLTATKTVKINVGATPPVTSLLTQPSNPSGSSNANFSFSSDQAGSTFECQLDGGAWGSCSSPKSYTGLADGTHTFSVRATAGGVTDDNPVAYSWTIDTSGVPSPVITSSPALSTSSTSASFAFTTSGSAASTECKLDAGAWGACSSPQAYSGLAVGQHTFQVRAKDSGGTASPAESYTWDITAPGGSGPSTPVIGTTPTDPSGPSVSFSFSGDAGNTFECRLDGGAWSACTSPQAYPGLSDGSHTFEVRASDGSTNSSPASHTWTVDATAPAAPTITAHPTDPSNDASPSFSFTTSGEAGATVECRLDGGAWGACSSPQAYPGLSDGSHTFEVRETDALGNTSSSASHTWVLDTVAPADPSLTDKPSDPSNDASPSFSFTTSGVAGATVECRLDGGAWGACSSPKSYTGLSDGSHTFEVRETDAAGNQSNATSYTWVLDATAPSAPAVNGGPSGTTDSNSASFSFSGSPGETFECRLDGGSWGACSSPKSYSGLSEGNHTFEVRAKDPAGNYSAASSRTFEVNTEGPALKDKPAAVTISTKAEFIWDGTASYLCQLDDGEWKACQSPASFSGLKPGSHTFKVRKAGGAITEYKWTVSDAPVQGVDPDGGLKSALQADAKVRLDSDSGNRPVVDVGCELSGDFYLESCEVDLTVDRSLLTKKPPVAIAADQVKVGTGTVKAASGSKKAEVTVRFNKIGQRLLREQAGGFKVNVAITAYPVDSVALKASGKVKMRPPRQALVPLNGLFRYDTGNFNRSGLRWIKAVVRALPDQVSKVRCVGHTDTWGAADYNKRLGYKRARTVCSYLRKHLKASRGFEVGSWGEKKPRATNKTPEGRAKNRRVEIKISY